MNSFEHKTPEEIFIETISKALIELEEAKQEAERVAE